MRVLVYLYVNTPTFIHPQEEDVFKSQNPHVSTVLYRGDRNM